MSGYSSVVSLGLLATPRSIRVGTYDSSPLASPRSMDIDEMETTPTATRTYTTSYPNFPADNAEAADYFSPASRSRASSTASTESSAPRLRRRRSSLTVGSNTLSSIKSPMRSATVALQRTLAGSGRSRSGSITTTAGADRADDVLGSAPIPIKGRLRSGSVGTALRPRRTAVRKPAAAPPTAPLPALPPLPATATNPAPRRPPLHHASNSDNGASAYLAPDFASKHATAFGTPPGSGQPSPIELPGHLIWSARAAKEN